MESSLFSFWSQLTGGIVFKFLRVKVKSSGSAEKGVTRVDPVADMFKVTDICRCNFCPVKANWLESQRISTLQGGCISWGCCEPKMSTFQKCPNCLAAMRESADGGRCPPESRDPPRRFISRPERAPDFKSNFAKLAPYANDRVNEMEEVPLMDLPD